MWAREKELIRPACEAEVRTRRVEQEAPALRPGASELSQDQSHRQGSVEGPGLRPGFQAGV